MRQTWMARGLAALMVVAASGSPFAGAEPTKYCGDRIVEAEESVKAIEAALGRVGNAQDKSAIESWVTQAKTHIGAAKSAAQEEDCVRQVELAKTLTQDALYLVAQTQ